MSEQYGYTDPTTWRYRLVVAVDNAFHAVFPSDWEMPLLCDLERRMWWRWNESDDEETP